MPILNEARRVIAFQHHFDFSSSVLLGGCKCWTFAVNSKINNCDLFAHCLALSVVEAGAAAGGGFCGGFVGGALDFYFYVRIPRGGFYFRGGLVYFFVLGFL